VSFTHRFDRDTEFCADAALHLAVEAEGADDLDLFVHLCKLDARGRLLPIPLIPLRNPLLRAYTRWQYRRGHDAMAALYTHGPTGRLRVSMRALDPVRSTEVAPVLPLQQPQPLRAGQVVQVAIPLRPMAWRFHAGEQLRLVIAGHDLDPMGIPGVPPVQGHGRGVHVLHTGPTHAARLVLQARGPLSSPQIPFTREGDTR
jgi:hypothetical protein